MNLSQMIVAQYHLGTLGPGAHTVAAKMVDSKGVVDLDEAIAMAIGGANYGTTSNLRIARRLRDYFAKLATATMEAGLDELSEEARGTSMGIESFIEEEAAEQNRIADLPIEDRGTTFADLFGE